MGDGVRRRSVESKAKKERDTSSVFDSSLVETASIVAHCYESCRVVLL